MSQDKFKELEAELAVFEPKDVFKQGLQFVDEGDYDGAICCFNIVRNRTANPQLNGEAFNACGVVLDLMGKHHEAKEQYRSAMRINPNCAQAFNNLGGHFLAVGPADIAAWHFNKAIEKSAKLTDVAAGKLIAAEAAKNLKQVEVQLAALKASEAKQSSSASLSQVWNNGVGQVHYMFAGNGANKNQGKKAEAAVVKQEQNSDAVASSDENWASRLIF